MKRIHLDQWARQLQPPRNPRLRLCPQQAAPARQTCFASQHTFAKPSSELVRERRRTVSSNHSRQFGTHNRRHASSIAAADNAKSEETDITALPSSHRSKSSSSHRPNFPTHAQAVRSARLAALHARLSLPAKLPLQTLARCLIDPSVDLRPGYNNAPLALLGQDLLGYATSEYLICHYPRLPMAVLFAAQYAYVGPATLASLRQEWGVDIVAAPGEEVDAGLLQFERMAPGTDLNEVNQLLKKHGKDADAEGLSQRKDLAHYRRGMSSRIVYDNQFGDLESSLVKPDRPAPSDEQSDVEMVVDIPPSNAFIQQSQQSQPTTVEAASASFVRALCGALYLHAGAQAAKDFHTAHILSRKLAMDKLFYFTHPTRDVSRLCDREGFEPPVARLISETGRLSRTPVFIVGVFSGDDKLGEGAGASLDEARIRAAAATLRSWYLYSPPAEDVVLPSEAGGEAAGSKKWRPHMVDPGEIIV